MRLPSRAFVGGFVLALCTALNLPLYQVVPALVWGLVATGVVFVGVSIRPGRSGFFGADSCAEARPVVQIAFGVFTGLLLAIVSIQTAQLQRLELDNRLDILVTGRVASIPKINGLRSRFLFEVKPGLLCESRWLTCRLRVSWYRPFPDVQPGEQLTLQLRVRSPRGFSNPAGFDYEHWLFANAIHASAYVRKSPHNQSLGLGNRGSIDRWRLRIANALIQAVPPSTDAAPGSGMIVALSVGIRDGILPAVRTTLQSTGTSHLLAISGMHVALIAGAGFAFGKLIWHLLLLLAARISFSGGRWFTLQSLNATVLCSVFAILAATLYALLAGFTLPTQRALVMVLLYFLCSVRRQSVAATKLVVVTLFGVVLLDPLSPLSAGLWLSFGAVLTLIYLGSGRLSARNRIASAVWIQMGLSLTLLPMTFSLFQQGSVIAPIANFVAIPLVTVLVLPLIMMGLLTLIVSAAAAETLLQWASDLLWLLMRYLQWLEALSFSSIAAGQTVLVAALLATLGCVILFKPSGGHLRWLFFPLMLPLVMANSGIRDPGFRVHVMDVGQGLGVIVETASHSMIYDTGPRIGAGLSTAEAVLSPYLQALKASPPDRIVVSHSDSDHASGVEYLKRRWPLVPLMSPLQFSAELGAEENCVRGGGWVWDEVEFTVLHPPAGAAVGTGADNDQSCVVLVSYGDSHVLLPGDIEVAGEQVLLDSLDSRLLPDSLDLLVAPHHGSKTSSAMALLERLNPKAVIYAVGAANRFGFPHEVVQMRYKLLGAKSYRTDRDGAVSFSFDREGLSRSPVRYRHQYRRLWLLPP